MLAKGQDALVQKAKEETMQPAPARPLALFTESLVALLSTHGNHKAFMDLLSLMGQTFPQAAPSLFISIVGSEPRVYSVLDSDEGGGFEAKRVLRTEGFSYVRIVVGGHPPVPQHRLDFTLVTTLQASVVLSINEGIHEGIFREWVKILAPAVAKLIDNEVLRSLAFRDGLTGVFNYRAFEDMLASEWERATRYHTNFSLIMIDIDHFKSINDTYGHPTGDIILRAVAQQLEHCVRKSDLVFRYGGEEFVVIMPHAGMKNARLLGERIRKSIAGLSLVKNIKITVSLGISTYRDGLDTGDLVKFADMGLYQAKENGRNRIEVVKEMT